VACSAIALVVVLPLLRPGYALAYDMVFVPHLPFSTALLGVTRAYPRAVPTDLLVALGSSVVTGAVVQKAVLLLIVGGGAMGAGRLVPAERAVARIAGAVLYVWNPFVYERLLLGQWALLLGYAILPWAVSAAIGFRRSTPGSASRLVLAFAGLAVSPYSAIIGGATTLVVAFWPGRSKDRTDGVGGHGGRRAALVLAGVLAVNLVWLVPALLYPGGAAQPDTAIRLFRARSDSPLGTVGSVVTLGGLWRTDLAPPGRSTIIWIPAALIIAGVAVRGWRVLRGRWPAGGRRGLAAAAAAGLVLALAASFPGSRDVLEWMARTVPGGGFLRDGQKFVMPLAVLWSVLFGAGVDGLLEDLPVSDRLVRGLVLALPLLPVALAPTLAWGAGGRLRTADYPASWAAVERVLAADPSHGAVLTLPWHAYLPFGWNHGATVHQPAPQYFSSPVVAASALELGSATLRPEDPWARLAGRALVLPPPLAPRLPGLGVHWVLLFKEADWRNALPQVEGMKAVVDTPDLTLYRGFPAGRRPSFPTAPLTPIVLGDLLAAGTVAVAAAGAWRARRRPPTKAAAQPESGKNG
jgi:hypothetical protein